jgi:hypothetical protein
MKVRRGLVDKSHTVHSYHVQTPGGLRTDAFEDVSER